MFIEPWFIPTCNTIDLKIIYKFYLEFYVRLTTNFGGLGQKYEYDRFLLNSILFWDF